MGNVLEGLITRPPTMNIPPEGAPHLPDRDNNFLNNPNRGCTWQIIDMMIQFAAPSLLIAAIAYTNKKHNHAEKTLMEKYERNLSELTNNQQHVSPSSGSHISDYNSRHLVNTLKDALQEIETEEKAAQLESFNKVNQYETGLKVILDIGCSPFKSREDRKKIELALCDSATFPVKPSDILDISSTDIKYFCGARKEENGKLVHLYVQNWRLQLELRKYKNILERFKDEVIWSANS